MGDLSLAVLIIQNMLKYNFYGRLSLLQIVTVAGISTTLFEKFSKIRVMEGNFSQVSQELVRVCRSFE